MKRGRHGPVLAAAMALAALAGCIDYLDSGELGRVRYFGEVRGVAPLSMVPPTSDRDGNVYALYGARDLNEVELFIGHARGGWTTGCVLHEGDDRGAHGWVGRATDRAWYWSGDALVEARGSSGACTAVLDTDPSSGANLTFEAVVPLVTERPSRATVPVLIQSAADPAPYHALVDLDLGRYTDARPFEPAGATDVVVLGVGADQDGRTGFLLVRYESPENGGVVEALYLDDEGQLVARAPILGADAAPPDAVVGYLQSVDGNRVVGLLETGELVSFDRSGGAVSGFTGFAAAGVHAWEGQLYLVGMDGEQPVVAPLDPGGQPGAAQVWEASAAARLSLGSALAVLDERSAPRKTVAWEDSISAIGEAPFVSAHSPDLYAEGTTGWLIAGPAFQVETNPQTSVAFAPVGISYP
jgi:hypothetical protein